MSYDYLSRPSLKVTKEIDEKIKICVKNKPQNIETIIVLFEYFENGVRVPDMPGELVRGLSSPLFPTF